GTRRTSHQPIVRQTPGSGTSREKNLEFTNRCIARIMLLAMLLSFIVTAVYSHASSAGSCRAWFAASPARRSISCASLADESRRQYSHVLRPRKGWQNGREILQSFHCALWR